METNSPNGSGKSTWRERLGIGGKELPKIAGEFSAKPGEPKIAPRPAASRASQPVTRPAPMAPRPAPGTRSPLASGRPAITPQTSPESLAERLRAQRAAAEKLAEQRVAAAKDRAGSPMNGAGRRGTETKPQERPKFSFADEQSQASATPAPTSVAAANPPAAAAPPARELPSPPRVSPSPIVPPRPALGGEPPRLDPMRKPGVPPYQPQFTPPPGGYRPLDPPGYQYQPRPPMRPYTPPSYGGGAGDPRLSQPPQARGGYRRPVEDDEALDDAPRRQRALNRARTPAPEDDLDEVFEDDGPPPKARRRASAQDYGRAYREYEDEFGDTERRRSRGPFMVLTALVLLAGLIGGGIWYYNNYFKSKTAMAVKQDDAPLVAAPSDPAKVDPPATDSAAVGDPAAPAAKAKLFYDRILGEQTIDGGQLVPTEETPVAPAPTSSGSAEPVPAPAPATAAEQPSAADPAAAPAEQGTEALPLPLPPPAAGDTQGAIVPPKNDAMVADALEKVIPAAAPAGEEATAPVPGEPAPMPAAPAAAAPGDQSAAPAQTDPLETAPSTAIADPVEQVKPVKKPKAKAAEAKTKKRAKNTEQRTAALGEKPVVLVPPDAVDGGDATIAPPPAAEATETPPQSGSFFGGKAKLKPTGKGAENGPQQREGAVRTNFKSGTVSAPPVAASEPEQVASIADDSAAPVPEPEPANPVSSGRYVVQLGSFRSEGEARSEAARLKSKTAALSGVGTSVVRATVFGSSRYRVMTSPVADRAAGERICEALLSANEPNCSVKAQ